MEIHIGKKIRERVKELKIGSAEFSRMIHTTRQNVNGIYKRSSIDTAQLLAISKALTFNFFELYEIPELKTENKWTEQIKTLKKEIDVLNKELKDIKEKNELLQKINNLLESKKVTKKK